VTVTNAADPPAFGARAYPPGWSRDLTARLRAAGCVFAEEEAALLIEHADDSEALEAMVSRRVCGEPLELVLGWAELSSVRVHVAPGVFVPRRRSVLLVELTTDLIEAGGSLLDLGCGTGAIAAAVRHHVPGVRTWAVDVDPDAVRCARRNLPGARVLQGDLYAPLPAGLRFDVVVANAPYVPTAEIARMPPEAREHEHLVALDGGPDGLDVHRRVIAGAPERLTRSGTLLVETSAAQATAAAALMADAGLLTRVVRDEAIGATAVVGRAHG